MTECTPQIYATSDIWQATPTTDTYEPCELCGEGPISVARICAQCAVAALLHRDRPRQETERLDREQVVYYLRFGDRVKIGTTSQLATRLTAIPYDEILAVEPGGYAVERKRHLQFSHLKARTSGQEWFHYGPDLQEHVRTLP